MEQKNIESTLKSQHTIKVLQFYNQENEKSRKIIEMSNEILQESYFVLNGNMLLTETMRDKFSQLYKLHDQRGVKFTETDEIFEISEHHNADWLFDMMVVGNDADVRGSATKRHRENGDDMDGALPTKKRVVRSIFDGPNMNTTHVLNTNVDANVGNENMNATFAIKPTANKPITKSRALKENNPNVHKGFAVPKPTSKSGTVGTTKVKSALLPSQREKENKRTPLKAIRRSPRSNSEDPSNRRKLHIFQ